MSKATSPKPTTTISPEVIKAIVYEQLRNIADRVVQDEVEQQIQEKLSGRRITPAQRTRIHKKVLDDVRTRVSYSEVSFNLITFNIVFISIESK